MSNSPTTFTATDNFDWFSYLVNATTIAGIISVTLVPGAIYLLRHEPLFKARMPFVIMTESIIVSLGALLFNFTQTSPGGIAWLQEDQSGLNCAVGNWIYTCLFVLPFLVVLGRTVIFIRIAQANTANNGQDTDRFDRVIHILGICLCPKDFVRLETRRRLMYTWDTSGGLVPPATEADAMRSLERMNKDTGPGSGRQGICRASCEVGCWLLKLVLWSCLWGAGFLVVQAIVPKSRNAFTRSSDEGALEIGDAFDCGVPEWSAFTQAWGMTWALSYLILLGYAARTIRRDSLGIATELLFIQGTISAALLAVFSALMSTTPGTIASELTAHCLLLFRLNLPLAEAYSVLWYPLCLMALRRWQQRRIKAQSLFSTAQDVEHLWHSSFGCALLHDISRRALCVEGPLFLKATDAQPTLTRKEMLQLNRLYIARGAPLELNLCSARRAAFNAALSGVDSKEANAKVVEEVRRDIFMLFWVNFSKELSAASSEKAVEHHVKLESAAEIAQFGYFKRETQPN